MTTPIDKEIHMKSESQILKDARLDGYTVQKLPGVTKNDQQLYSVYDGATQRELTAHEIADKIYVGIDSDPPRSIKPVAWATVLAFIGILLLATAAHACEDCEVAQSEYCDGLKIVDYCADLPDDTEYQDDCPILCGLTRCDYWYQHGKNCNTRRGVSDDRA